MTTCFWCGRSSPESRGLVHSDARWLVVQAVVAHVKYLIWLAVTKIPLGVLYVSVMADGLRYLVPALGQKLYKLPGLSFLQDYEATYRLDLAPLFALFLLLAVFWLWGRILRMWLFDPEEDDLGMPGANAAAARLMILGLGLVILGADLLLFYISMTQSTWGGTAFSVSALIATAAYVAVLIFVSLVSVVLHQATLQKKGSLS
jgi:hypothetical protein